ncbi:MAG: sulfatase [Bacteroidales bacterium]|nr:sulfatase [Bacteroidales bacterium]
MTQKINSLFPLLGALAVSCSGGKTVGPNIVYVFPDQFRNQALSFWNDPDFEGAQQWKADPSYTPRLNAFAREAVVLNRATSACPLSSPYRGMFLTGMYPERNGVYNNCMATRATNTLDSNAVCISDVFHSRGWDCGYIGKLHAEVPMKNDPDNPGHYVSSRDPEWDAYTPPSRRHGFNFWYSYGTFDVHRNPHYWDTEGKRHDPHEFSVRHETDKAISYILNKEGERDSRKPFFLCVAYNPPHQPYGKLADLESEEDLALYADKSLAELYVRENADTTMPKAPSIRYYLANVTAVDRNFGRILDALKEAGLEDNTIVVFTSDHGETMCSHGTADPKNTIWTESFNVPFMIRWPSHLAPRVDSVMLTSTDIMPTLLSMAGLRRKIPRQVQGRDLSKILEGKADNRPDKALYLRCTNGPKDDDGLVRTFFQEARGIKTPEWTMEVCMNRDTTLKSVMIFNDVNDPYQMHPVSPDDNPELFRSLLQDLQEELVRTSDAWAKDKILGRLFP